MAALTRVLALPPPSPAADSDVALMAAVAAKDARAQRALVDRLGARVRRVAGLLSRSSADADDAAQQAMLEILRSADGFREASNLHGWADRITVRTTLRQQRREQLRRSQLLRWLTPGVLPWGNVAAFGAAERTGLGALLGQLSPERRTVLVLRHALEYSVEEIAELTGAPTGTVKDRLVAARKQLKRSQERDEQRSKRGRP